MGTISTRAAVIVAPRDIPLDLADRSAPPTSEELLRRRWDLPIGHPDRATIRAEVVEEYLPMAGDWPAGTAAPASCPRIWPRSLRLPW